MQQWQATDGLFQSIRMLPPVLGPSEESASFDNEESAKQFTLPRLFDDVVITNNSDFSMQFVKVFKLSVLTES